MKIFKSIILGLVITVVAVTNSYAKPRIALIMKSLANEFFLTMEIGAKEHQKANSDKYELIANGIKNESDVAKQIKIMEQMVAIKVDAIVLAPADSTAMISAVKRAMDAGVVVINIDNAFDKQALTKKGISVPFVGPDNRKGAKAVGDYLAPFLSKGNQVAIIEGVPTAFNAQQRTAGFKDAMDAAKITIVTTQTGMWEMGKAHNVASAIMNEYPKLKAILCGNDSMALGAVAAVKAAGKISNIKVVGFDNIAAVQAMLKDGRVLATADQYAGKQAVFGIEQALKAIAGEKLAEVVETPVDLITKDKL
ncbi:MAG: sugar ABC transporter substrate-binding protein [Desulfobacterales bacterium]|nr:sugar ABC transporter substrate-binding protein [Desulfobacterales bacterium]